MDGTWLILVLLRWHCFGQRHGSFINLYAFISWFIVILVWSGICLQLHYTVYPKKYAHGFVVLCFVVVMQSFIMNSHEVFIHIHHIHHIHQGCFAGTGAIDRLPQCQWSKPDGYGKISQCITTTKHSKAKTVCIFLGIYCISKHDVLWVSTNVFSSVNVIFIQVIFSSRTHIYGLMQVRRNSSANSHKLRLLHI